MMKYILFVACFLFTAAPAWTQDMGEPVADASGSKLLLLDINLQIEATKAVNDMYNFDFPKAERQFRYLKYEYPNHPLPDFLMGLSAWWRIMPNIDNKEYDARFLAYMDSAIYKAERILEKEPDNEEAKFFLAGAWAFEGRLYSERKSWRKAALAGKRAMDYLELDKENQNLGPEFMFGKGLYNYYREWVPEHYGLLKPFIMFFPGGDKEEGIRQLRYVANNAFYTRIEAQYFLMRILALDENKPYEALQISEYLHTSFPNNPYFHRYYARMLYSTGQYHKLEPVAKQILQRIDSGAVGYENISGRYASFYLGQMYQAFQRLDEARHQFERTLVFARADDAEDSGYMLYALYALGEIAEKQGDKKAAKRYYKQVKKYGDRDQRAHEKARERLKEM